MAEEGGKGVALAILGIVAVIAIVGLVLLFAQAKTSGEIVRAYGTGGGQFGVVDDRWDDAARAYNVERGLGGGDSRLLGKETGHGLQASEGGADPVIDRQNRGSTQVSTPAGFRSFAK